MRKPNITTDKCFEILPGPMPEGDDAGPAMYPYPRRIGDADNDVLMAEWGQSEGTRQATKKE